MRGARSWAVAVRTPSGEIDVRTHPVPEWTERWRKVPFVRGLITLGESLVLGIRALRWSARVANPEDPTSERGERIAMVVALVMVVLVFGVAPGIAAKSIPGVGDSSVWLSLVEGAIRAVLLVGYIALLGVSKEVRRVFEYHGAEHQVIAAQEAGCALEPDQTLQFSTKHPRCGTAFLLVVVLVSFFAHVAIGHPGRIWIFASRVLLIPVVAGASYELIRLASRHQRTIWGRVLSAPGLLMQRLTTRPPTADQAEVAIASLRAVLSEEEVPAPPAPNATESAREERQ